MTMLLVPSRFLYIFLQFADSYRQLTFVLCLT